MWCVFSHSSDAETQSTVHYGVRDMLTSLSVLRGSRPGSFACALLCCICKSLFTDWRGIPTRGSYADRQNRRFATPSSALDESACEFLKGIGTIESFVAYTLLFLVRTGTG